MSGTISTLARRWKMALQEKAQIALRPRWAWLIAAAAPSIIAVGCNHRRQSLRPIFTAPAAVSAPCTNCGSGGGAVIGAPSGVGSRPLSSEPALDDSLGGASESTVPSLAPTGG